MSVYVFRNAASDGAKELAMALGGRKIRFNERYGGLYFKRPNGERVAVRPTERDTIVCWGEALTPIGRCRVLNGGPIHNKYNDAVRLRQAGVPTIEVSQTRPVATPAAPPIDPALARFEAVRELIEDFPTAFNRGRPMIDGMAQLADRLGQFRQALTIPAPVAPPARLTGEWLPRMNNHVGGNDLMTPPARPDFWVKKLDLVREFRVHSFLGRSIRAGVKQERAGATVHPWIRSYDGGWGIVYDGVTSRQQHRDLAHRACQALELQFGAVDIGELRDGSLVVLEVNRAPGLEGGTVTRYSSSILRWMNGELED